VVTQIVEDSVLHEGHLISRVSFVSRESYEVFRNVNVGSLVGSANVVDETYLGFEENDLKGSSNIFHEEEVTFVGARAMQSHFTASHQLVDELRNELLGVLMRAVDIVAASNNDGHAKRAMIRLG